MDQTGFHCTKPHWWSEAHEEDGSLIDVDHRIISLNAQEESLVLERFAEVTRPGEPYDARACYPKQELDDVNKDLDRQARSPSSQDIYGSNGNVYNPYNPFTSKEYITQEIAAGRMRSAVLTNQMPQTFQSLQEHTSRQAHRSINVNNHGPVATIRNLASLTPHLVTEVDPASMANASQSLGEDHHSKGMPLGFPRAPNGAEFRSRLLGYLPRVDRSRGCGVSAGWETEKLSVPLLSGIEDTFQDNEFRIGVSGYRTSDEHRIRFRRSLHAEGHSNPTRRRMDSGNGRSAPNFNGLPTVSMQIPNDFSNRKGRRPESFSHGLVSPAFAPGFSSGNHLSPQAYTRRPSSYASGAQNRANRGVEPPIFVHGTNTGPDSADIEDHASQHSLPSTVEHILHSRFSPPTSLPNFSRPQALAVSKTSTIPVLSPPRSLICSPYIIFTSEIIPRKFHPRQRLELVKIFRNQVVPLRTIMSANGSIVQYDNVNRPDQFHYSHSRIQSLDFIQPATSGKGWPEYTLPVEVFQDIVSYLSQRDLKTMRLVNHEFERKVSNIHFHSVVVPFRSELYGLFHETSPPKITNSKRKGKGRG